MTSSAEDLGSAGFDFEHGFGVVNGCALADKFGPTTPPAPEIDELLRLLCRLLPSICQNLPAGSQSSKPTAASTASGQLDPTTLAYAAGYLAGRREARGAASKPGCCCGDGNP
jgi:hypothetical protein